MKSICITLALCSLLSGTEAPLIEKNMETPDNIPHNVFPLGDEIKNENFSGRAWLYMLSERDKTFNCPIGNVTFEPGCRNRWHKHPGGQILLCTSGQGYYQEKGKAIRLLKEGDTVHIAPMLEHWHGASPNSWFSHLSIETNTTAGNVEWLNAVSETEYAALPATQQ